VKFLIDANLPYSSKILLESMGFDASHVKDVGLTNALDDEIFLFAQKNECIIITRDLDFSNIIKFVPGKYYGIIVMRVSYVLNSEQINNVLKEFFEKVDLGEIKKALVILEGERYRLRKGL